MSFGDSKVWGLAWKRLQKLVSEGDYGGQHKYSGEVQAYDDARAFDTRVGRYRQTWDGVSMEG